MSALPLVTGVLALIGTWAIVRWLWLAPFTSVLGLIIPGIMAHGVGTAVAIALDLPSEARTFHNISRRLVFATAAALLLYVAVLGTLPALIYLSPGTYRAYPLATVIFGLAIAYSLCAILANRLEPAWPRYGTPLALASLGVAGAYVMWLLRMFSAQ